MKLTDAMMDTIKEAAERIKWGDIHIIIAEHMNSIDIEVSERLRFERSKEEMRPGQICGKKVVRVVRNDH